MPSRPDLRTAVRTLLDVQSYREAARRIADEVARLPTVADAVPYLVQLAENEPADCLHRRACVARWQYAGRGHRPQGARTEEAGCRTSRSTSC